MKIVWNAEKIIWTERTGQRGIFQQSEDYDNADFKAMVRDIIAHGGKLTRDDEFYWTFKNDSVVGRKKRD